ncbi:MAG: hypothetical protein M0P01_11470 [Treponema sp.]|nr:hypothetical protein [Treponema sp.]
MTIKSRNIFLLILLVTSLCFLLTDATLLFYNLYKGTFIPPDTFFDQKMPFFFIKGYRFSAVIFSLFIFLIYVSVWIYYIYVQFEKTQSTEIIFFALFLCGCLTESVRLYIPLFNLWHSLSTFLIFSGRLVIFGRTLAPLALLFDGVFSGIEQRQYVERNILILFVVSIMTALLIPLDTAVVLPNCCIRWGEGRAFLILRILVLTTTAVSLFINSFMLGNKEKAPYGFLALAAGYEICCYTTSYPAAAAGCLLLFAGTAVYLGDLHRQYLWK